MFFYVEQWRYIMKKIILFASLMMAILLVAVLVLGLGPPQIVAQEQVEIPFLDLWQGSGHADAAAEAFVHWDEDDPAEVPEACARCHSTPGYRDWIGADGTEAGVVEAPAPIGTLIECVACHNDVTLAMTSVVMPSGIELTGLGREARCMQCHQGRHSTVSVNAALEEAGVADEDTVSEDLGFLNIHYFAAAASKYGTLAQGGYEYDGKSYDGNFAHVDEFDTCQECHNPHTLQLRVEACSGCHAGVREAEDLKDVRMPGSLVDYDGDGDTNEGAYFELEGLQELLYQTLQAYATEVAGADIAYESHSYPYFFLDTDGDGEAGEDEAIFPNQFNAWTPRLLKAAYNYQVSAKDPGAYAHGGKYIIQLLYDSIEDLNTGLSTPVDLSAANRIDAGHFAGSEEAFRHWDEDGELRAPCSRCHSTEGLPVLLKDNAIVSQPLPNGFKCTTCHESLGLEGSRLDAPRRQVDEVEFPSGAVLSFGEGVDSNLCLVCHQGRESKYSVDALLLGLDEATIADLSKSELLELVSSSTDRLDNDTVADNLRFLNIHYFAAGATRFGSEAKGAYEYDGKEYQGFFEHTDDYQACADCHNVHSLQVKVTECSECHEEVESKEDLQTIRISEADFDGDGDTAEGMAQEVETMREALYAAMQAYAASTAGTAGIVYDSHSYPYFFTEDQERYASWTPRLLKAAYNYQYSTKDPGAFTHNGQYIIQILYDSLEDIGGDTSGMTRP
jgi:hypothetical protein